MKLTPVEVHYAERHAGLWTFCPEKPCIDVRFEDIKRESAEARELAAVIGEAE